jgi:hypothetical protein
LLADIFATGGGYRFTDSRLDDAVAAFAALAGPGHETGRAGDAWAAGLAACQAGHKIARIACFVTPSPRRTDATARLVMSETEFRAGYYREQGRQIRALISLVISADVKAELLELAEQFERLAAQADHAAQT